MRALFIGGTGTVSMGIVERLALDYVMSHKDSYEEDPEFDEFCDKIIDALDKAKESAMNK